MNEIKKEIKEALLGDLVTTEDGRLAVSFTRIAKYRNGLGDGYDKVMLFGVMCRRRWYLSRKGGKQLRDLVVKGMQDMGRMMRLSSNPNMEAVYCTYLLNNPAILTFSHGKDGVIEITAYSGRGLSGWLACFRTLNKFQKKVPEILQRMSEEDEQKKINSIKEQDHENRLLTKQEKKEKKQEKKRKKKEKRRERMQRIVGALPKMPELPNLSGQERTVGQSAGEDKVAVQAKEEAFEIQKTENGSKSSEIEALRMEQTKLEEDAVQAKLEAQAVQAKLEAAQARLAAKEAQDKLAQVEAILAAQTQTEATAQTQAEATAQTQAEATAQTVQGANAGAAKQDGSGNKVHNGNNGNKKRKKKR